MEVRVVGVAGCGLMGSGIAEVCARAGYQVVVREISEPVLQQGLARITASMDRGVAREKLTAGEKAASERRIKGTTALEDLAGCDIVIEAIVENMAQKKQFFGELDALCPPTTVFASNTSSLGITEMASATRRAERFIGLHFFNPAPVMKLVEIIRGLSTSEDTLALSRTFCDSLGKTTVVSKDYPGFIVTRLHVPFLLDAVRTLELGIAGRDDIDTAVSLGLHCPMGPLAVLDFVGIDTVHNIAEAMFAELKDPRYAVPPLMRRMVLAGHHGRKTGKGFYDYPKT